MSFKNTILCLLLFSACLVHADVGGSFYKDRERGWYWGEEFSKKEEDNRKHSEKDIAQLPAKEQIELLQKELEESKIEAIMKPSIENAARFLAAQKKMLDLASEFARYTKLAGLTDPSLIANEYPTNNHAAQIAYKERAKKKEFQLRNFSKDFGLIIFVSPDCPYCTALIPVIQELKAKYNFDTSFVSYKSFEMGDVQVGQNLKLIKQLKLETYPSVYVFSPEKGQISAVAYGFNSIDEIENNILKVDEYLKEKLRNKVE